MSSDNPLSSGTEQQNSARPPEPAESPETDAIQQQETALRPKKSVENLEASTGSESVVTEPPTSIPNPAAAAEPVTTPEPVADSEPVAVSEPVTTSEPVPVQQTVVNDPSPVAEACIAATTDVAPNSATAAAEPPDSAAPDSAAPDSAAPDSAAPDSAAPDSAAPEPSVTEPERRRPVLRPSLPAGTSRAVPSLEPTDPVATGAESQRLEMVRESSGPVEIPRDADLDDDIEAQIQAAMSNPSTLAAAGGAPATDQDGAPDATADGELEPGQKVSAVVQQIHSDNVFLEMPGEKCPVVVSLRQFESGKHPTVGDRLTVTIDNVDLAQGLILGSLPRGKRKIAGDWDAVAVGQVVDCLVTKANKGGLEVTVSSLRGFLPASQIDTAFVAELEPFIGQKLQVQVTEVNPRRRNLVVSRRALLMAERQESEEQFWKSVEEGQIYTGTVKTMKDYGVFVDLGGADGFLHISEIGWSRIAHPSEAVEVGQQVEVKVLSLNPEKHRIGLGMKQLTANPWTLAADKYASGREVSGNVTRIMEFGAFVELESGVEGLIHVSELAWRRVRSVDDVVQVGQDVTVKVLEVDPKRQRISLSLKQTQERPEMPADTKAKAAEPDPAEAARIRRNRESLRGGRGGSEGAGSGLFGNPGDFTS